VASDRRRSARPRSPSPTNDPAVYTQSTPPASTRHGTGSLGHRVIILTRCETRVFPVFEKKAQDKDIKIYIFVKIRPTVIEILTLINYLQNFTFQKRDPVPSLPSASLLCNAFYTVRQKTRNHFSFANESFNTQCNFTKLSTLIVNKYCHTIRYEMLF